MRAELTPSQLRATLPAQHPLFRHSTPTRIITKPVQIYAGSATVVCVCAELTPSQLRATLPAQPPLFRHSKASPAHTPLPPPAGVTAAPPDTPLTPSQQTSTHPIDSGCQLGDAPGKATSVGMASGALAPIAAADKSLAARGEASVKAGSAISMVKRLLRSSGPVQDAVKPADALRKHERCEGGEAGVTSVLPDQDMAQADDGEAGASRSVLPCPDNGDSGEQPGGVGVPAGDDRLVCVQMLCVCKTQGVLTEHSSKFCSLLKQA